MSTLVKVCVVLLATLILAIGMWLYRDDVVHGRGESPARPVTRRVVLITCDTLRADHLGCYGYERPTSPRIDAWAAQGLLFTSAWSAAPMTMPSLSSLMAGRLPDAIGATPSNQELMPSTVLTLAEVMREAGFDTAAIVSNIVLARPTGAQDGMGVAQGFAYYDDQLAERPTPFAARERNAGETTDAVLRWLDTRAADADRFLLWVHYMDPHGPYTPAQEHVTPFMRDHFDQPDLTVSRESGTWNAIPAYQVVGDERKPGQYIDRYDGEIHQFDAEFGRLLDALRDREWLDDALIVFSADHGESLGENQHWFTHGDTLQRELLHVPLVVSLPAGLRSGLRRGAAGVRVDHVAMHLDIWPTVLEAVGIAGHTNLGSSLLDLDASADRIAPQFLGRLDTVRRMVAVSDGRWRLVTIGPRDPALYDELADPNETTNLAGSMPAVVARLQDSYGAFIERAMASTLTGELRVMDDRTRRAHAALGYTGADEH